MSLLSLPPPPPPLLSASCNNNYYHRRRYNNNNKLSRLDGARARPDSVVGARAGADAAGGKAPERTRERAGRREALASQLVAGGSWLN